MRYKSSTGDGIRTRTLRAQHQFSRLTRLPISPPRHMCGNGESRLLICTLTVVAFYFLPFSAGVLLYFPPLSSRPYLLPFYPQLGLSFQVVAQGLT